MIMESLVIDCRSGLMDYIFRNGESILPSILKHLNLVPIQMVMRLLIMLSEDANSDSVTQPIWWGDTSELMKALVVKLQDYTFSDRVCDLLINVVDDVTSQV